MVQLDLDLLLALPSGAGRRAGLQEALRHAIRTGALRAGTRLPSSRVLAADLSVSRGTVVDAYDQLAAEGWLLTRPASGTLVADVTLTETQSHASQRSAAGRTPPRHDLRPGRPEAGSFPRAAWLAATRSALAQATDEVWDYGHAFGRPELRRAVAEYLGRARGVITDAERIVVCAGFSGGLGLVASLLVPNAPVAVEHTTLAGLRAIIDQHGHPTVSLPVDDHGAVIDALDELRPMPTAVMVTPAHQYPLGASLAPVRRHQLCRWAKNHHAVVIEDDYDGEFRYDRQPVGALQGLDPDRVIYGGTTSKTLAPSLRLGWLALPAAMAHELTERRSSPPRSGPAPVVDQLALAELLGNGGYDRHVRRMRRRYHRRRNELLRRLAADTSGITVAGTDAGLHAVLWLPPGTDEATVLAACANRQIAVDVLHAGTRQTAGASLGDERPGIVVGYATPAAHAFSPAIAALTAALADADLGK
ncbi:MAG: MocR-like pyridoxine biosynthesis transcription factor PdxR [Actinomycetes bacterium]